MFVPFLLDIVLSPFSFGYCIICPFSFSHCIICPFSFGYCIICPFSFWLLYYLPFLLAIVLSPFSFGYCIICPFSINGFWLGTVVMVIVWLLDLQPHKQSIPITTYVVISNPARVRCTRYNIMWWSLSVTCMRQGTPVFTTKKADRHDIAEILLKVALSTINITFIIE